MRLAPRRDLLAHSTFGARPAATPRPRLASPARSSKQHVPSDSFGGISPEKAASKALRNLFTFIAARIVLAQLEGSGRGSLAAYNKQSYDDLSAFLQNERMVDCDEWLQALLRKNSGLALRLMEVRLAYATDDFEWDHLQRLALKDLSDGNLRIMRSTLQASLNVPQSEQSGASSGSDVEEDTSSSGSGGGSGSGAGAGGSGGGSPQ